MDNPPPFDWSQHPQLIRHPRRRVPWLFRQVMRLAAGTDKAIGDIGEGGSVTFWHSRKRPPVCGSGDSLSGHGQCGRLLQFCERFGAELMFDILNHRAAVNVEQWRQRYRDWASERVE